MHARLRDDDWSLTEKEKQTLRLIVRGHDAKSTARSLNLSVHTINERLREARRKMAVSSSREAARLLLEAEGGSAALANPQSRGDEEIGEAENGGNLDQRITPIPGEGRRRRLPLLIGVLIMTLLLGLLALSALSNATSPQPPVAERAQDAPNAAVVAAARQFLVVLDQSNWNESYRLTGSAFQKLNTVQVWADVSRKVRPPLGAMTSRTLLSVEELPAPPHGYQVVKFRTSFANKASAIETVTLDQENGRWVVVGIYIV